MQQLLGKNENNQITYVEINENGTIKGFKGYDLIHPEQAYDDYYYMSQSSWTHDVTVAGGNYKTGDIFKAPEKVNLSDEDLKIIEDAIFNEVHYCAECCIAHDSNQYMNPSFAVVDCEVFCKECVNAEDLLTPIESPEDVFSASDISEVESYVDLEEVATLFCDSSGFGRSSERALTKKQALESVEELMKEHGPLVCGLTGTGQFQVYLTIYKRVSA